MIFKKFKYYSFVFFPILLTATAVLSADQSEHSLIFDPLSSSEQSLATDSESLQILQVSQQKLTTEFQKMQTQIMQMRKQIESLTRTTAYLSGQTPLYQRLVRSDLPFILSFVIGVSYLCVTGDILSAMSMATGVYYCLQILAHYMVVFQRRP